jgi:radical SAM superfamily enzyme YgiQ (UPF0313 family)
MSHGKWEGLTAERVIQEINFLVKKYKLDGVAFYDSNFFANEKRVGQICVGITNINIKWGNANGNIKRLLKYSRETWALMQKSGCSEILIGVESGDDKLLQFLSKQIKLEDIIRLKKISRQYDIKLWISLMVGIPYNLENKGKSVDAELSACTKLVQRLYAIERKDRFALFIYTPYPGTLLYEYSIKNGVKAPQELKSWSEFDLNTVNIPWIKKRHIKFVDFLSNFIFTYSMPPFQRREDFQKQRLAKKIYLWVCYAIASFRIKYNFYRFNLEFIAIKFIKSLKTRFKSITL